MTNWPKKKKKAVTEATETWNTAGTTAGPVWWSWPVRSRAKLMSINWPAPGWSVPRGGGEELWWQRIGGTRNTAKTLIAAGNSLAGQGGQSRTAVERTPLGHYIRCLGNRASCRGRGSWRDWRLQPTDSQHCGPLIRQLIGKAGNINRYIYYWSLTWLAWMKTVKGRKIECWLSIISLVALAMARDGLSLHTLQWNSTASSEQLVLLLLLSLFCSGLDR